FSALIFVNLDSAFCDKMLKIYKKRSLYLLFFAYISSLRGSNVLDKHLLDKHLLFLSAINYN
ncbi:MAG: hypothetical protein KAT65_19210, partial [Methanophagales archaeon]|nr:hypothetical protein [Methanophagales archaeon]